MLRATRQAMFTVASVAVAMALTACSLEPGSTDVSVAAYTASSQVPKIVAPDQVAENLPGCFELLTRPGWTMDGDVALASIGQNTRLGLLFVDGNQLCVDRFEELTTWMSTGRWPMRSAVPYVQTMEPTPPDQTDGHLGNHEFHQVSAAHVESGATNTSDDNGRGDGVIDDGNPLPPYPRPAELVR